MYNYPKLILKIGLETKKNTFSMSDKVRTSYADFSDNLQTSFIKLSDNLWTNYTNFFDNRPEDVEVKVKN